MPRGRIPVVEIFESIQGEGESQGKPALFIRLAGCNLKCKWCDTKYSWNLDKAKFMRPMDIADTILKYFKKGGKLAVITGGEPMIWQKFLVGIIRRLERKSKEKGVFFKKIEIETNGTIRISNEFKSLFGKLEAIELKFNVSPKLMNSGNWHSKSEMYSTYSNSIYDYKFNSIFKFVVERKKDLEEVNEFVKRFSLENVWLMPQASTRGRLIKLLPKVWRWCVKEGYSLSSRLHIITFSNKRGV